MKSLYLSCCLIISLIASCTHSKETQRRFDQDLVDELAEMVVLDQVAASHASPPEGYTHLDSAQWEAFKDSVYRMHQGRLAEILDTHGYPGFDQVGEEGEGNFWLMVQHSDFDPAFQQGVLTLLAKEVENKNADPYNFALLTDRVRLNTGQKQLYGSQVTYIMETGQAIPKPLEDSLHVNARRAALDQEPIEAYLNTMTEVFFVMNPEFMKEKGITEPQLYKVPE